MGPLRGRVMRLDWFKAKRSPQAHRGVVGPGSCYRVLALRRCSRCCSRSKPSIKSCVVAQPN